MCDCIAPNAAEVYQDDQMNVMCFTDEKMVTVTIPKNLQNDHT